jgi:putative transcriptional regulator
MRKVTPLTNLRKVRTLNQEQLASLAGISQQTLSKIERGTLRASPDVKARLAAILGTSVSDLFPEHAEVA